MHIYSYIYRIFLYDHVFNIIQAQSDHSLRIYISYLISEQSMDGFKNRGQLLNLLTIKKFQIKSVRIIY